MTPRTRELFGLLPASLLVTAGFAAVFVQEQDVVSTISLTYGAVFLGLCFAAHLVIRWRLPHADPYVLPLVAVLASFGLVMIYRLDDTFAREQAQWFVIGLAAFIATIVLVRDYRALERYRYVIAAASLGLLLLPRIPGIGSQTNGAYLGVDVGPVSFQPAEFAKIGIIIFLASYLRDTRQLLVQRKVGPLTIPRLKHLGPLLLVWGLAMVTLVFIRDLGSSLMFFGGFLAMLYVATNRLIFPAAGLALFGLPPSGSFASLVAILGAGLAAGRTATTVAVAASLAIGLAAFAAFAQRLYRSAPPASRPLPMAARAVLMVAALLVVGGLVLPTPVASFIQEAADSLSAPGGAP